MSEQAELLVNSQCEVGESPVWNPKTAQLAWVDISGQKLWVWDSATGQTRTWATPQRCGCIALTEDLQGKGYGVWLAGMEDQIAVLTPHANGELGSQCITRIEHPERSMRFNDGRCDRQGRLRAGTMVQAPELVARHGQLFGLDGQHARVLQSGFLTPNGMAYSPDGRQFYISDSHPDAQQIWRYEYDTSLGVPHSPTLFLDMRSLPGRPDGAAIDTDGGYWICGNDAGQVHRITPDGRLDRSITLPVKKPAMCSFGGADMRTLFITSIRPAGDVSDQPLAGSTFAIHLPYAQGILETPAPLPL